MGENVNTMNTCGIVHGFHAEVYSCGKNLNYLVGGVDAAVSKKQANIQSKLEKKSPTNLKKRKKKGTKLFH